MRLSSLSKIKHIGLTINSVRPLISDISSARSAEVIGRGLKDEGESESNEEKEREDGC
jgi:hypothetical protein